MAVAERISFFVRAVRRWGEGWRLDGEPGFEPSFWARPGDRFDVAMGQAGGNERRVALLVEHLTASYAVVSGAGGDLLEANDIVVGERSKDGT